MLSITWLSIGRSSLSAVAAMALRRLLLLLCCKIALADKDPSAGSPQHNDFCVAALQRWSETMDNEADPRCNLLITHRHISATSDGTQIRGLSRQLNDNLPRTAAQQQKMFETMVTQFCEKAAAPPRECGRQSAWMQPIVRGSAPLGGGAFAHAATGPTPSARPRVDAAGRPMPELHAGAHAHDRVAAMAAAKGASAAARQPRCRRRAPAPAARRRRHGRRVPWASTTRCGRATRRWRRRMRRRTCARAASSAAAAAMGRA